MTEIVRLTLLCHGMTEAMSTGRFPADEGLNDVGVRQVGTIGSFGRIDAMQAGPEERARHTATLLGWQPETDGRLADLDYGQWRGQSLGGIAPADLKQWVTEPTSAPHGGESVVTLLERVSDWMAAVSRAPRRLVAVAHPAVLRAAILITLEAPPKSFWRIDIRPASRTMLHYREQAWTLRAVDHQP